MRRDHFMLEHHFYDTAILHAPRLPFVVVIYFMFGLYFYEYKTLHASALP
jgi:hypothetical protein